MSYYNGTYEEAAAALRYLASNERPKYGQQRFNAEHLYQLADELATLRAENAALREQIARVESEFARLRENLIADAEAMASHGSGTSADTIRNAIDAASARLGMEVE